MSAPRKYSVTIEDCPEDDEMINHPKKQDHSMTVNYYIEDMQHDSEQQSWDKVDQLEEQARNERLESSSADKRMASSVAHIVESDMQNKKRR